MTESATKPSYTALLHSKISLLESRGGDEKTGLTGSWSLSVQIPISQTR